MGSKILPDGGKQNYEGFIVMNVFAYTYCSAVSEFSSDASITEHYFRVWEKNHVAEIGNAQEIPQRYCVVAFC